MVNSKRYKRKNYNRSYRGRAQKTKKRKSTTLNVLILLVLMAISYTALNMINTPLSNKITSRVNSVFSSDMFSLKGAKDKVIGFVNNTASVFNESKTTVIGNDGLTLEMPVNGEVITTFKEETHPVFNTSIKPRGIEIKTGKNEEVLASASGKVTNIIASSYGGSRVVFDVGNSSNVVYDGVKNIFVKVGDTVETGNIIGTMASIDSENVMGFEVWVDNTAMNPLTYMNLEDTNKKEESIKGQDEA